jgi:hypothetical protein
MCAGQASDLYPSDSETWMATVTPWFQENETEASIHVLMLFKSHVYKQYSEQIQYLDKLQAKILQNDPWVRKKITE